jgi:hypothetical protein
MWRAGADARWTGEGRAAPRSGAPDGGRGRGAGADLLSRLMVVVLFVASVGLVHRDAVFSGMQVLTGDEYDGLIAVALISHWHNVLSGMAAWHTVGWFHPFGSTLGYNDGYLLFGVVAHLLRLAGADVFLAVELTAVLFSASCFVAAFVLARRLLGVGVAWAGLAAAISAASPGLAVATLHIQLHAVGPAVVWCAVLHAAVLAFLAGRRGRFLALSCLGGLLGGALMLTAFYVFWVVGLLLLLSSVAFAAILPREGWRQLGGARPWPLLAVPAVVLVLALTPAVALYVPLIAKTGTHGLDTTRAFALGPLSVFDTGPGNAVWGWLSGLLDKDAAGLSLRDRYPARGCRC